MCERGDLPHFRTPNNTLRVACGALGRVLARDAGCKKPLGKR